MQWSGLILTRCHLSKNKFGSLSIGIERGRNMAIRTIRVEGDPVLNKVCRPVKEMTERTQTLIDDMLDTMYEANGVGLAAPQVGVLRRIVVIDVGEGPIVMINPEIIEQDGEQTGQEGCLSIPDKAGIVTRPNHVIAKALDRDMQEYTIEGTELLARAICHELDHLDGHLYDELAEGPLMDVTYDDEEMEEE
jgi:peptide deformylase